MLSEQGQVEIVACVSTFTVMSLMSCLPAFFPLYALSYFNATNTEVGVVMCAFALFSGVASPIAGAACSHFGRGRIAMCGLVLLVAGSGWLAVAPSMVVCMIARSIQGVGAALVTVSTTSILLHCAGDNSTRAIALQELSSGFGWLAGPTLGGELYDAFGYTPCLLILASFPLILVIILPTLLSNAGVVHNPKAIVPGADGTHESFRFAMNSLKLVASNRTCLVCFIAYFLQWFAGQFIDATFEIHAYQTLGCDSNVTGLLLGAISFSYLPGCYITVGFLERFGFRRCVTSGLLLWAASVYMLGPPPFLDFLFPTRLVTYLVFSAALVGVGLAMALVQIPLLPVIRILSFQQLDEIEAASQTELRETADIRGPTLLTAREQAQHADAKAKEKEGALDAMMGLFNTCGNAGTVVGALIGPVAVAHTWQTTSTTCELGADECLSGWSSSSAILASALLLAAIAVAYKMPGELGKVEQHDDKRGKHQRVGDLKIGLAGEDHQIPFEHQFAVAMEVESPNGYERAAYI